MQNEPKLGFGEAPDATNYIFIGDNTADGSSAWYFWDHAENAPLPIKDNCLNGYFDDIFVTRHESKAGINYKLNVKIKADKTYCIRSGVTTNWSRGILLAMEEALDSGVWGHVKGSYVSVAVKKGDEDKVIFSSFYINENRIYPEWDAQCQLLPIINRVQEALGREVQTQKSIDNPDIAGRHNQYIAVPDTKEIRHEQKNTSKKTPPRSKPEPEDDESSDDFVF